MPGVRHPRFFRISKRGPEGGERGQTGETAGGKTLREPLPSCPAPSSASEEAPVGRFKPASKLVLRTSRGGELKMLAWGGKRRAGQSMTPSGGKNRSVFRSGRPSPNLQECFPVRKLGKKCKALLAGSEYRLIINTLLPFPAVSSMHQSLFLKENTSRPLTPQGEDLTCSRFDLKTFINPSFGRAEGQQVNRRGGRGKEMWTWKWSPSETFQAIMSTLH